MSADDSKAVHCIGDESHFMPGGYDLAALAAGGAITAMENVLDGSVRNAYALCRCVGMCTSEVTAPEGKFSSRCVCAPVCGLQACSF
jgi:hypothetical protein